MYFHAAFITLAAPLPPLNFRLSNADDGLYFHVPRC